MDAFSLVLYILSHSSMLRAQKDESPMWVIWEQMRERGWPSHPIRGGPYLFFGYYLGMENGMHACMKKFE